MTKFELSDKTIFLVRLEYTFYVYVYLLCRSFPHNTLLKILLKKDGELAIHIYLVETDS